VRTWSRHRAPVTGLAQDCPDTPQRESSSDRPAVPSPPPAPDRIGPKRACPRRPITGVPAPGVDP
jgi:hypothetical protein